MHNYLPLSCACQHEEYQFDRAGPEVGEMQIKDELKFLAFFPKQL